MSRFRLFIGAALGLAAMVVAFFVWRAASLNALREKALKLADKGEFLEAEPALKASLTRDPYDVDILRALAKGYLANARRDEADECLTKWLATAPDDPEALLSRIDLYRDLGQFDKAILDSDRLLEVDAGNTAWRRKRLGLLFLTGRFTEAEKECRHCLQKQPGDRSLLRSLAEIKRFQGDLAEAGTILDGLLREAPHEAATLMARALLYYYQDESEKSIPLFREVLERDPNRQRAGRYHLSLALNRVGQTEEASRLMEEVRLMQNAEVLREDTEFQRGNLTLQMRNARAQFENNDLPRTTAILRQILSSKADFAPAHALMADVLDKQGRSDLAADHRRRAKENP